MRKELFCLNCILTRRRLIFGNFATKYTPDTIFTDQTKLFVGVVKYNQKFTIDYANNLIY